MSSVSRKPMPGVQPAGPRPGPGVADRPGAREAVRPSVYSWHPPGTPAVRSLALGASPPAPLDNGALDAFRDAIEPAAAVAVTSQSLQWAEPRAVAIRITRPEVRIRSFSFEPPGSPNVEVAAQHRDAAAGPPAGEPGFSGRLPTGGGTRIRPPRDIVKLEDRLQYLLQPPLESLLAERALRFPFHPFPYQFEGVAFLYPRHAAILADEMGLGKTMQAITAIRLLLRCGEVRTVLLICPKPLVSNWQREFALWAPEVTVMAIEGDRARRAWQWQLPDVPVRIANYELLCRDRDLLEAGGNGIVPDASAGPGQFDLVLLDEAQRVKNRSGATSQVARTIPRRRSWALTGTPVENSAEDLVGIFEFLAPGFLSPDLKPRRMGRTVRDYVLRRTKDRVLTDLPPKLFRDADLELTPEQRETYQLAEEDGIVRLSGLGGELTIQHVFELILRLKQICNFDPASGASSKLERLDADLEEVAGSGRKAIVFSQWVGTLKRLAKRLRRFGPLEYHGKIPPKQRDVVIERFRSDPSRHVMLMSYGAGGVGLNLQFAGYVFLFDRWWNPAVEDQAINRAHRIGADGPVTVTRFLVLGTIEERIERVLEEKRELFDTIFSGATGSRKLGLSQDELFGLFELRMP
ncbi:MAG: DEAD/DEAH box helicase [Thermoguttaceae bacterium]|nr:DEAD/DEAH box helicase [Thermoguttaceae bacterium]